ncbi:pfkB family kinase, partial [Penicillium argentinense]
TPHFPDEDEKLRASGISRRRGGNCPNTLEVLQQLARISPGNLPLALVTVLPRRSSIASRQIIAQFEPHVNLGSCIYRESYEEPPSSYIIKSQSTGSRTVVNHNELPDMTVEEFVQISQDLGPRAKWFHFEGRAPGIVLECIRHLRAEFPSAPISVEIEKPGRPGLQELANAADVVFYSKSWALGYGYASARECLKEQSFQTPNASNPWANLRSHLFCTWGQDGAELYEKATGRFMHAAAYTTENFQVVDPVGAGDTFIAGMLYALNCKNEDWDLCRKLEFANRVAGMKVSQEGFLGLGRALTS